MPPRFFRTEIAGVLRVGLEFDSEIELDEFLGRRGIVLLDAQAAAAVPIAAESSPPSERRGRPSRDEEIAAAIDALDEKLDRCVSIKAQARAVRTYLEDRAADGGVTPPALSTIETFIKVYRKPSKKTA